MRPAVFIEVTPPRYLTSLSEARQYLVDLPTLSMVPASPAGPSILAVGDGGRIIHRATRWPMTEQAFHLLAAAVDQRLPSLVMSVGSAAGSIDVFNAYARHRKHNFYRLILLVGGGAVRGVTRRQKFWRPAFQDFETMMSGVTSVVPSWTLVRAIMWSRSYNLVFASPTARPEDDCRVGVSVAYDDAVGGVGHIRPVLVHARFGVLGPGGRRNMHLKRSYFAPYDRRIAEAVADPLPVLRHTEASLSRVYLPAPGRGSEQSKYGPMQAILWRGGTRALQTMTRARTLKAFEACWAEGGSTDLATFLDVFSTMYRRGIPSVRTVIEAVVYDIMSRDMMWLDEPAVWNRGSKHGKA